MRRRALLFLSPPLILTGVDKNYWRRRLNAWRPPPFIPSSVFISDCGGKERSAPCGRRALLTFYHRHSYLQGWDKNIGVVAGTRGDRRPLLFRPTSLAATVRKGARRPVREAGAPFFIPRPSIGFELCSYRRHKENGARRPLGRRVRLLLSLAHQLFLHSVHTVSTEKTERAAP